MTASPLQNDSTRSLIFKLFTEAADEDYIVARVAFQFGLPNQFSWSAQQAIEKYLKGALLLNGISVKKSRHNIVNLFSEIRKLAPD